MKLILFYLKFGNQNLWRRRIRTFLLGFALIVIAFMGIIFSGFSEGVTKQMIGGAIDNFLGDYIVYPKTATIDPLWPRELVSFDTVPVAKKLAGFKDITVRKQYRAKVFAYSNNNQQSILALGVEQSYKNKIDIIKGQNLTFDSENQILITSGTAEKLGVNVGDSITVEVVTPEGRRNIDFFLVKGIYQILGVSRLFSGHMAIVSMKQIQTLMNDGDTKATEIIINMKNRTQETNTITNLNKFLTETGLNITQWSNYGATILSVANAQIISFWVIWAITMLIVMVFLYDTLYSVVEERKKEYSTMISMGLNKAQIAGVFVGELTMLIIYFIIPGIILGGLVIGLLNKIGIPIQSEAIRVTFGGYQRLYPLIGISSIIMQFIVISGFILITGLYLIIRLTKLKPMELFKNG